MKVLLVIAVLCIAGIESTSKADVQGNLNKAAKKCPSNKTKCVSECVLKRLKFKKKRNRIVISDIDARSLTFPGIEQANVTACIKRPEKLDCEIWGRVLDCVEDLVDSVKGLAIHLL